MGIDVFWKDEQGKVLGVVEDNGALSKLSRVFYRQSSSVCLRYIDPAGDACFNQQQLSVLLMELRLLLPEITDARPREHLQAIMRLLEGAEMVHTYIWFIGD
ncbi:hypothetical protein [Lysobacter gummosus]|uniref:Uncharacterized protein n=1 Tax=Lysobacter gummosus TaxID=262324 RepID=A0ABY3X9M9_9GAMM|nr:hypothetical protein [Lysobacter gummosus]UNP29298.1 hypothetical protein MOV92_22980 [Lysobacter gummosus]